MPAYTVGSWTLAVADDGTVAVLEDGVVRETLAGTALEERGETRPAYVRPADLDVFRPIVRRVLHWVSDRRRFGFPVV